LEISSSLIYTAATTMILYFAKVYHDHQIIIELQKSKENKDKRLKAMEDEVIKIIEALERTYTTSSRLYDKFYDKDDIDLKLNHLKELVMKDRSGKL